MRWLLAASYPLLSHFALMRSSAWAEWAALMVLFAAFFYPRLGRRERLAWLGYTAYAAAIGLLMAIDTERYALYLPPLVFPSLALVPFVDSLRRGRTPLITQIAAQSRGGVLPPELLPYTRSVTWSWVIFIGSVLLVDFALIVFGSREAWSLWTNFIGYGFLGSMFVVEYAYRRVRFRHLEQQGFFAHLRTVARARPGAH